MFPQLSFGRGVLSGSCRISRQPAALRLALSYAPNDYKSLGPGLKAAGYATAPDYAQRLIRIIEESKLYLLDREDGLTIYGAQTGHLTDDWFSGQSNVDQAAAIASGQSIPTTTA